MSYCLLFQRPWSLCENLGATESIITACAVMTHANMLPEDRLRLGIVDGFIRVSVGVEVGLLTSALMVLWDCSFSGRGGPHP